MSAALGNGSILTKALRDLLDHWEETAPYWRDEARERFERDFINEIAPAVRAAFGAVQEIENQIRRIRKECS